MENNVSGTAGQAPTKQTGRSSRHGPNLMARNSNNLMPSAGGLNTGSQFRLSQNANRPKPAQIKVENLDINKVIDSE